MSSILSDAEKAVYVAAFQQVVDTFVRPLTIYQEATRIVIVSDPNYNPWEAYNQNSTNVQNVPNFTVVQGRILYDKNQEWSYVKPYAGRGAGEGQIKQKDQTVRSCRLKVDEAGYNLMKTAKLIELDGLEFNIESQPRPHGLFVPNYYTFYLIRAM